MLEYLKLGPQQIFRFSHSPPATFSLLLPFVFNFCEIETDQGKGGNDLFALPPSDGVCCFVFFAASSLFIHLFTFSWDVFVKGLFSRTHTHCTNGAGFLLIRFFWGVDANWKMLQTGVQIGSFVFGGKNGFSGFFLRFKFRIFSKLRIPDFEIFYDFFLEFFVWNLGFFWKF